MTDGSSIWLSDGIGMIDLKFRGLDRLIASYVIDTSNGLLVIETGPANAVERLLDGIRELGRDPNDIRHIAVTHIHLDHAAGAGTLLGMFPDAKFYVHRIGARHMIDPSRLLDSAGRIYGDQMLPLWGVMKPAPSDRTVSLEDNDQVTCGDVTLDVLYTPGHASHHVSYAIPGRGLIFTGDVAGVMVPPSGMVWPPTPPPDIDADAWHQSVRRIRELTPDRLLLTHFGPVDNVTAHLDQLEERLDRWVNLVWGFQKEGLDRDTMMARMEADAAEEMIAAGEAPDLKGSVSNVTPFGMAVDGLTRYLSRRA